MNARLERILYKLAQQHAPHLVPLGWEKQPNAISKLARSLANYDVNVLIGEPPKNLGPMEEMHLHDWVRGYAQLYSLLAQTLFPTFARVNAYYADNAQPPVIVLHGDAIPIMITFAGYVIPYLAVRQPYTADVTDLELRGFMDFLLTELEALNLPNAIYDQLRQNGVAILRQLLRSSVRHISLTTFDKALIGVLPEAPPPPATVPKESQPLAAKTPPPAGLPEQTAQIKRQLERLPDDELTPTEDMFAIKVPLSTQEMRAARPRPPVPPLPEREDK